MAEPKPGQPSDQVPEPREPDPEQVEDDWQPRKTAQALQDRMHAFQQQLQARVLGKPVEESPPEEAGQQGKVVRLKDWRVRYYHNDHLGTPRELSDEGGAIVWQATYKAWGNTLKARAIPLPQSVDPEQVTEIVEQNLRFQGQYFDEETGLHYNRFRYYEPDLGRYVSQDPVGLTGGDNFYHYSPNPTGWLDPLGLQRKKCKSCDELECDLIQARLQAYANQANVSLSSQPNRGLSPSQVMHVKNDNAWACAMHYGTQLDKAVKDLVRMDPILSAQVSMPAAGPLRPDFEKKNSRNKKCKWFDLTTAKGWPSHVSKYLKIGQGRHISYSTPQRNF